MSLMHFSNACHAQSDGKFCNAPGAGGGGKAHEEWKAEQAAKRASAS